MVKLLASSPTTADSPQPVASSPVTMQEYFVTVDPSLNALFTAYKCRWLEIMLRFFLSNGPVGTWAASFSRRFVVES